MDILDRALPKWPQMLVWGERINPSLALEIIRRTEMFFLGLGGNDHEYNDRWWKRFHYPQYKDFSGQPEQYKKHREARSNWIREWGYLDAEYIYNAWISTSFIFGPHGWCWPDGTIAFDGNVGKWPTGHELYAEWKAVAEAFPALNMTVVFMDDERDADIRNPIMAFRINGGKVEVVDPLEKGFVVRIPAVSIEHTMTTPTCVGDNSQEHGLPEDVLEQWAKDRGE